jgi:hypothetical protein
LCGGPHKTGARKCKAKPKKGESEEEPPVKKTVRVVAPSDEAGPSRDSSVAANPLIEVTPSVVYSVVVVEGLKAKAYGIYTDRGVITQGHIVEGSETFKIYPIYSPANCEVIAIAAIKKFPGDTDLILVPLKMSICIPVAFKSFLPLSKATNSPTPNGAVICPTGVCSGVVTYKPDVPTELLINGGTKAGMCGSPYVVNAKIVGFHAFGNNNGKDNGAFAVTPELLTWLAGQPKN